MNSNNSHNLVYTAGVFDLLHLGHLNFLETAKSFGTKLIVGLQEDRSVISQKGTPPVHDTQTRLHILRALRCVDDVITYNNLDQRPIIIHFKPNTFVIGPEYGTCKEHIDVLNYCYDHNIKIHMIERLNGVSSSFLRKRLKQFWEDIDQSTTLTSFSGEQNKIDQQTIRECKLIIDYTKLHNSLLDLGCGDGRMLRHLANHYDNITAIDYSSNLLNNARSNISQPNVEFINVSAEDYSPENKVYDNILISGLTPYLDDFQFECLLHNLDKLTKCNSRLFIRTPISVGKRLDITNHYSHNLESCYTAYYRTHRELTTSLSSINMNLIYEEHLYTNQIETELRMFIFEKY